MSHENHRTLVPEPPRRYTDGSAEVLALQWPENDDESYTAVCQRAAIHRWVNGNGGKTDVGPHPGLPTSGAHLITTHCPVKICSRDYVVRQADGRFFVCDVDLFEPRFKAVSA